MKLPRDVSGRRLQTSLRRLGYEEPQRRNLNRANRPRRAVLDRVRSRIDLLATERKQLLKRGKVACRFEELTIDTPRNRYVRGALDSIARIVQDRDLAHRCRKLAHDLRCLGVTGIVPTPTQMSADRFGRHDANDRFMVAAARLAFEGRRSEGMLLHPSVGEDIDEAVRIQGHTIRFATVNLAGDPTALRDGLLRLVDLAAPAVGHSAVTLFYGRPVLCRVIR